MEFRKGQLCLPKKPSSYLARKYGKPRPVVRIEAKDTDIWPGGWKWQDGNPVCMAYAMRSAVEDLPLGGVVYYAKVFQHGELFHESELEPYELRCKFEQELEQEVEKLWGPLKKKKGGKS